MTFPKKYYSVTGESVKLACALERERLTKTNIFIIMEFIDSASDFLNQMINIRKGILR